MKGGGKKMTFILPILFWEGRKFTKFQFYTPAALRHARLSLWPQPEEDRALHGREVQVGNESVQS